MNLRRLIPFFDKSVSNWSTEARLLHWLTFVWLCVGLIVLFSASYAVADGRQHDGLYYFKRQLMWASVGIIFFQIIVNLSLRVILRSSHWFIFILLGLIVATLIPGLGAKALGASRWINLGPIPIQPSELVKPFLVLQSARLFSRWDKLNWRLIFAWLSVFCLIILGILAQPNLSTTALCGMTLWLIALAAGLPYKYLGGTALGGMFLALLSISLKEYQRRRIMSFINPWADPTTNGYQLIQSLLAVGSGGTLGSGFGFSQQKLLYLPIQDTDFIFSVFAEEFGFAGSMVLLLMFICYATLGLRVALKATKPAHGLVAIGTSILMVGQSLIHIAVASGALPTTGLPLPMFSYGGSSMISSLVSAALLIRVARESSEAEVVPLRRKMH